MLSLCSHVPPSHLGTLPSWECNASGPLRVHAPVGNSWMVPGYGPCPFLGGGGAQLHPRDPDPWSLAFLSVLCAGLTLGPGLAILWVPPLQHLIWELVCPHICGVGTCVVSGPGINGHRRLSSPLPSWGLQPRAAVCEQRSTVSGHRKPQEPLVLYPSQDHPTPASG